LNLFIDFIINYWTHIIAVIITILIIWDYFKISNIPTEPILNSYAFKKIIENSNFKDNLEFIKDFKTEIIHELNYDLILLEQLSKELEGILDIDEIYNEQKFSIEFIYPQIKNGLNKKQIIALIWICFWIGFIVFLIIRMILLPFLFITDGITIAWFIYYISIGFYVYFK